MHALTGDIVIPALITAIAGVIIASIGAWQARQTRAQTKPNGGASLRDAVDRTLATVDRIEERQLRIERRLDRHDDLIDRLATPKEQP